LRIKKWTSCIREVVSGSIESGIEAFEVSYRRGRDRGEKVPAQLPTPVSHMKKARRKGDTFRLSST
jgi:hypothetical protein